MKRILMAAVFLTICLTGQTLWAGESYWSNMGYDFVRGTKNVLSSPAEIPLEIARFHKQEGPPVLRHFCGLGSGIGRTIERFASGAWDYVVMVLPGDQEGVPPEPETLF